MDITIVGAGKMARGIATRAIAGGHDVTLHTADGSAAELAGQLPGQVTSGSVGDPIVGEVLVLATPFAAVDDVLTRYGRQIDGKVVVDITNPVDWSTFTPLEVEGGSSAQRIAERFQVTVVKAFNTTFAATLVDGAVAGQPLDVFLAGDDENAKATVRRLAEDGGLRALDAGPLARARQLESLGYFHMALQQTLGTGFKSAVKVLA